MEGSGRTRQGERIIKGEEWYGRGEPQRREGSGGCQKEQYHTQTSICLFEQQHLAKHLPTFSSIFLSLDCNVTSAPIC